MTRLSASLIDDDVPSFPQGVSIMLSLHWDGVGRFERVMNCRRMLTVVQFMAWGISFSIPFSLLSPTNGTATSTKQGNVNITPPPPLGTTTCVHLIDTGKRVLISHKGLRNYTEESTRRILINAVIWFTWWRGELRLGHEREWTWMVCEELWCLLCAGGVKLMWSALKELRALISREICSRGLTL
jgi:hypothetical protein